MTPHANNPEETTMTTPEDFNANDAQAAPEEAPDTFDEPYSNDGVSGTADLADFDDEFDDAEAPNFEEVPDGKFQVRVQRVELGTSQAGNPMLKWDLIVLSGQHAGRHIFKNSAITHKSLPFIKGDLQTLGVQLPKFSDLPNHLDALLDQTLEVTKRTKGEFTNVYYNRQIDLPPGALEDDGSDLTGDAPF